MMSKSTQTNAMQSEISKYQIVFMVYYFLVSITLLLFSPIFRIVLDKIISMSTALQNISISKMRGKVGSLSIQFENCIDNQHYINNNNNTFTSAAT